MIPTPGGRGTRLATSDIERDIWVEFNEGVDRGRSATADATDVDANKAGNDGYCSPKAGLLHFAMKCLAAETGGPTGQSVVVGSTEAIPT